MKTLIELYDPAHPVKNILAALIFKPEVLIFIGLKGSLTDRVQSLVERLLRRKGIEAELRFMETDLKDGNRVVRMLEQITWEHADCVFEISGGPDLLLALVGHFCALRGVPQLYKDVDSQELVWITSEGERREPLVLPKLGISDLLLAYGARLERTDHYYPDLGDAAQEACIGRICQVFLRFLEEWPHVSVWFQYVCRNAAEEDWGYDCLEVSEKRDGRVNMLLRQFKNLDVFYALQKAGAIHDLAIDSRRIHFRFENTDIRRLLTNQGVWLELCTYLSAAQTGGFDDLVMSAVIGWDYENKANYPQNEIDVVLLKGIRALFISCKTSITKRSPYDLYEIKTLCERFGGDMAQAVLITADNCLNTNHSLYIRAREMGIVILDINTIKKGNLGRELLKIAAGRYHFPEQEKTKNG